MVSSLATSARRMHCLLIGVCCLLTLVGCNRGRRIEADLYQRELRLQEDEIYRLEDYISEYQMIVRDQRRKIAQLSQKLESNRPEPVPASKESLFAPQTEERSPPAVEETPDAEEFEELPDFETPAAEPASPVLPPQDANELTPAPPFNSGAFIEPNPIQMAGASEPTLPSGLDTTLLLEVSPGEEPRSLLVELTDEQVGGPERYRYGAAIMLTGRNEQGKLVRLARWDFSADEFEDARTEDRKRVSLLISAPPTIDIEQAEQLWVRLSDRSGAKRLQRVAFSEDFITKGRLRDTAVQSASHLEVGRIK